MFNHHYNARGSTRRKEYRKGRNPTAVKVFTINQESRCLRLTSIFNLSCRYLLCENVPSLNLQQELFDLFSVHGFVEEITLLKGHPAEEFTEAYCIRFKDLVNSRLAKRQLDDYVFFSNPLQLRYCPEYETIHDTHEKLKERILSVSQEIGITPSHLLLE
ncbi:hypothetical protein DSO57_1027344 [Entomophthora muscae]|uniref:Uncharacterized protein n=1 Tax=Entomophthora muscae TaxID=34485 RepID=A0ACC2TZQ2_9FUNG|nr:hypothetical protein DSO57_1027344 [Entomophthora muscae]